MPAPDLSKGKEGDTPAGAVSLIPLRYGARSRAAMARAMGQPEVGGALRTSQAEAIAAAKEKDDPVLTTLFQQSRDILAAAQRQMALLGQRNFNSTLQLLIALAEKSARDQPGASGALMPGGKLGGGSKHAGRVNLATWYGSPLPNWYDPTLVTWQGITLCKPAMVALQAASRRAKVVIFGGGFRSHAAQKQVKIDKPDLAATAGYSYHEVGLAIDVDLGRLSSMGKLEKARAAMRATGWNQFNISKEPWHFSYGVTG